MQLRDKKIKKYPPATATRYQPRTGHAIKISMGDIQC
jgi:hypothetical protein